MHFNTHLDPVYRQPQSGQYNMDPEDVLCPKVLAVGKRVCRGCSVTRKTSLRSNLFCICQGIMRCGWSCLGKWRSNVIFGNIPPLSIAWILQCWSTVTSDWFNYFIITFFHCFTLSFHFFCFAPKHNYTETNTLINITTFSCFICSSAIDATKLLSILKWGAKLTKRGSPQFWRFYKRLPCH